MRHLIYLLFILLPASVIICRCSSASESPGTHPNIVYILADDMGYGDIGALNSQSRIPTPYMDQLVSEGMSFTDAHAPVAVCTPTRYGILTGRYCFRSRLESGVLDGYSPSLIEPGRMTIATLLKKAGYTTACIGKWHLGLDFRKKDIEKPLVEGPFMQEEVTSNVDYSARIDGGPADHDFDYSFVLPASLDIPPYLFIRNRQIVNTQISRIDGTQEDGFKGRFWRSGDASAGFDFYKTLPVLTKEAIQFIQENGRKNTRKPFFLYFALTAPHTPWVPLETFTGKSGAGKYGDFVAEVDQTVGEIVRTLKEQGLDDNTIVILTSDNGAYWWPEDKEKYGHFSNYKFSGMKSDVWEGGQHIPYIVRWPGKVQPGTTSSDLVCLTDLMATCAEITGVNLPYNAGEDSFSHLSALLGQEKKQTSRNRLILQSVSGMYAIREGKWKLIMGKGSGGWTYAGDEDDPDIQLYDMETDIAEKHNLFADYPDIVRRLKMEFDMYKDEERSRYVDIP